MEILGIDIGGSGIKGAPVNIETGKLSGERFRIPTPKPSKPKHIVETVKDVADFFDWKGPVGCGFPTVIHNGKSVARGNIHKSWLGVQVDTLFSEHLNLPVKVINDADAAGLAEMNFGTGVGKMGLVILVTIGTGLGTGVFFNGQLIPNFELGRLYYKNGELIEYFASDAARKKEKLSYKVWGKRFNKFLKHVVRIFSPDLIIIGGGASNKFDSFRDQITIDTPILIAENQNGAGIIGAAVAAKELLQSENPLTLRN